MAAEDIGLDNHGDAGALYGREHFWFGPSCTVNMDYPGPETVEDIKQVHADIGLNAEGADLRTAFTVLRTVYCWREPFLIKVGNEQLHYLFSAAKA
ncbi:hypothetical protein PSDVSF_35420 [Pseudodesulfovibrio sediminis]|uniref:Uncharacterized protein n=1 Tax=Pseudodesulfovibrio sediminis TaxID=2810563 RepID=A0ABN6EXR2_9BACT|nr:hypothetical protein PSDVSF_35420 [Pseudodesulfovibrio sediminis]